MRHFGLRFLSLVGIALIVGCAQAPPTPSAASPLAADQPSTSFAGAAALLQTLGPFTLNGAFSFADLAEKPRVFGTHVEFKFRNNGNWVCSFARNPNPPVERKFLADPPTVMGLLCSGGSLQAWATAEKNANYQSAWRAMLALGLPETATERERFETELAQFHRRLVGPEIGENVRMRRVLAETAVREVRLWEAVEQFEQGLALAPWWPQGNYNLALVYAELQVYPRAIRYMQRYIKLVPDAVNARAAQDKIYEWTAVAQRSGN